MYEGHGGNLAEVQERFGWLPEEILDFSTNINPLGIPGRALKAFVDSFKELEAYPDPKNRALLRKAAACYSISPRQILAGNGSTEFIFLIPRSLGLNSVLIFCPTYQDYEESARRAGCRIQYQLLDLHPFIQDLHSILSAQREKIDGVFLCNPNNPTGSCFAGDQLLWLIRQHPSLLFVVDEAYVDFVNEPGASLLNFPIEPNVIILKSLTKIFSMPGLRLGLAFACEAMIRRLEHWKEPWTVSRPAQKTGEALLEERLFLKETREFIQKAREDLLTRLVCLPGLEPVPSEANYVLVRLTGGLKADELKEDFLKEKILIRSCQEMKGLGPSFFRIAVKKEEDHQRLAAALSRRLL